MKLWKVDTKLFTVREVEGAPWPAKDAEGDTCFDNTHFTDPANAWMALERDIAARVSLAGADVRCAEGKLRRAHATAAEAAKAFEIGMLNIRRARREAGDA